MYSPTTRLLTVLELLQSYKHMSGTDLARRLEVDKRTVRRYITMLQDMGIPVEAERGPYGAYQLQRSHKLPPMMFTDAEAIAMTLGLLAIRQFQFPVDVAAVEGALAKTERVMPEKLLNQVRGLQEAITFNSTLTAPSINYQHDLIALLSLAVRERQQVTLRYKAWNGEESEREFDPYGLVVNEGFWYTAGYCHLRHDLRTFRLDRIVYLAPIEKSFERPEDFDVLSYVISSIPSSGEGQLEVLLETTLEEAQQVITPIMGTLEETEGGVIFRRSASQLKWVAHVLLSVDFPVHIINPPELREMLRQMAVRAAKIADDKD
jgi:predicted DNA-binding transcriptional regulator YafY